MMDPVSLFYNARSESEKRRHALALAATDLPEAGMARRYLKPRAKLASFWLTEHGYCRVVWTKADGATGRAWLWMHRFIDGDFQFTEEDRKEMPRSVADELEMQLADLDHAESFEGWESDQDHEADFEKFNNGEAA